MAFVPGNSTGYAQPLDVAVMRPFKSCMKHHATETLVDAMGDDGSTWTRWQAMKRWLNSTSKQE
eukprot:5548249-Amphidinium_carterae.1